VIDALRYEFVRIRSLRSTYWLSGLTLLLCGAVAGLAAQFLPEDAWADSGDRVGALLLTGGTDFSPLPFAAIFMSMIGAFAFGHEYRYNTILSTLAAVPRRAELIVAKILVLVGWSIVVTVLSVLLNWALIAVLAGESLSLTADPTGPALVGYLCYVVLWSIMGLGLAALLRNLPVAIVLLFLVPLIVEPVISGVIQFVPAFESIREVAYYLPSAAGTGMLQTFTTGDLGFDASELGIPDQPGRVASGLTFAAWTFVVLLPAWALFHKRDA
jgi:ABC-2 type transport system permease protein